MLIARARRLEPLTNQIKAAGVPIHGVSLLQNGSVRIDFTDEATAQQRADAQAMAEAFNWDAPPTADEKAGEVPELAERRLQAAQVVVIAAILNRTAPPAWAVDLVNQAAAKVLDARK